MNLQLYPLVYRNRQEDKLPAERSVALSALPLSSSFGSLGHVCVNPVVGVVELPPKYFASPESPPLNMPEILEPLAFELSPPDVFAVNNRNIINRALNNRPVQHIILLPSTQ